MGFAVFKFVLRNLFFLWILVGFVKVYKIRIFKLVKEKVYSN